MTGKKKIIEMAEEARAIAHGIQVVLHEESHPIVSGFWDCMQEAHRAEEAMEALIEIAKRKGNLATLTVAEPE